MKKVAGQSAACPPDVNIICYYREDYEQIVLVLQEN